MKKHKIDQLFAEKLKNHKTPPPDKVWEVLSEELGETSDKGGVGVWWKVAAVVLLCVSAGVWVYHHHADGIQKEMVAREENTTESTEQNEKATAVLEENRDEAPLLPASPDKIDPPLVAEQQHTTSTDDKEQGKPHEKQDITATPPEPSETPPSETWVAEQPVKTVEKLEPVANLTPASAGEADLEGEELSDNVTVTAVAVHEPVKIIYKANTSTIAADAETEKDGKFLEVVKDIKNGDLGLADLRDAKSDLIASAFSKLKDKLDKQ